MLGNPMLSNLRYTLRQFRLSPVFSLTAILTLALGIGGTTAIFTLIHAVMLRSLPVSDPQLLYRIGSGDDCCGIGRPQGRWGLFSFSFYQRLAAATPEFEQITAFQAGWGRLNVRRQGAASGQPLTSEYVTGNYFSTLGVRAYGGRLMTPEDDTPGSAPAAVLSHRTWQITYGSDPTVVGSTFTIEGHPFTIVGVTPPGFFGDTLNADPPDIWIPIQQERSFAGSGSFLGSTSLAWLRVIGRLHPGASTTGMAARLTGLLRQWLAHDAGFPPEWMPGVIQRLPNQSIDVIPAGSGITVMKEEAGRSLEILFAVCGIVLLIACANVANLLLARAASRRSQTAVRLALGASRKQVVAQALFESVILAIAGGAVGLLVAAGAARLLLFLAFRSATFLPISAWPSPLVLAFAFAVALLTGMIFGAAPAWFATRTDPVEALRGAGRSTADRSGFTRTALLVLQAALSVVLVAGATMLARSLSNLENQNFGFGTAGRVIVSLHEPPAYSVSQLQAIYGPLESGMNSIPGVRGSGLALYNPLTDNWGMPVYVAGQPPQPNQPDASWDRVSANFLQNFGMHAIRGRNFTSADNQTSRPVAVVNQALVKLFFKPGEDPVGQHFGMSQPSAGTFEIVGVVPDAKFQGFALAKPARPMFYVPLAQHVLYKSDPGMQNLEDQSHFVRGLMLVTDRAPGAIEPELKRLLAETDSNLSINYIRTVREQLDLSFAQERTVAGLAGLFGSVALLLAAIGLYGVTAYAVAQRTNEIGIRMALGADRGRVVRSVLASAFFRVAAGLALGLPLALGAARLIAAQLYGVSYWDPIALSFAALALGVCSLIAALIPASVAASISPMSALRAE
jgi:predicted permease